MIVRTITQLPENSNKQSFLSSWMEMSTPLNNDASRYASKKVLYKNIRSDIHDAAVKDIVDEYHLTDNDGKINVSDLKSDIQQIIGEDFEFRGKKKFTSWPYVDIDFPQPGQDLPEYGNEYEYILPNIKKVKQLVADNSVFMSTQDSQVAEGNPLPQHASSSTDISIPESLEYSSTIGRGKFYFWHIDAQQTDSSMSIHDADSGSTDGYEEIRDTGNLVIWGWLAENVSPIPEPEQCWVGLFAKMKCENYNNTEVDVPVSIQPWIRGKNSSSIQYLSFNIPVKKGLRLKIKTGFPVNGENSGIQRPGSLTFLDGNIPNAFFGYVIK